MKEDKSVYLAWQDPVTLYWYVVGLLTENKQGYSFNYTKGALESDKFIPFSGMNEFNQTYVSDTLFPLFHNRLLSERRPEYPRFIAWLGLDKENTSPIDVLARSGGARGTDKLQMFSRVELDSDNKFEALFFAHGLGYLGNSAKERISSLKQGDVLYLGLDCQNEHDKNAITIRAEAPAEILGYCPRYLVETVSKLLTDNPKNITITVAALSDDAPSNYKLMCMLSGSVPLELTDSFFNNNDFQLVANV
jgi:hypothetical protein